MVKLKNFTLDGKAFRVHAFTKEDGSPAFTVEFLPQFDKEGMSVQEYEAFVDALREDTSWSGLFMSGLIGDMKEGGEIV